MLLTKEVEVKPTGKMVEYYKNKGYDAKFKQPLLVKVEDLSRGSYVNIEVLCDYCGETICNPVYRDYCARIEKFGNYACFKCYSAHQKTTCLFKYGVDIASKREEIKEKTRKTNLQKYGVPYTQQSPEVRAKANKTLCKNGTQKTSKQQLYLHSLYGGEINYAISYYAVDICFPKEKLVVEYDGGGHDLRVTLGRLTQEEFNKREVVRNVVIKREGYKQIKIVSSKDLLPSDPTLLKMLSEAKQYFSETAHSWMTFDIDSSRMINAENKDTNGIPYSFGELRKIKDSDLPEIENNNNINLKGA